MSMFWEVFIKQSLPTGIEETPDLLTPISISIYPNPFMENVSIYLLGIEQRAECIELEIFDVKGRSIRHFILYPSSFIIPAKLEWDGTDSKGNSVPSGVYFYRVISKEVISEGKLIKLK